MTLLVLVLASLWAMALVIWLMWKWLPPGDKVRRPPSGRLGEP